MKKLLLLSIALLLLVSLTSCATLLGEDETLVTFVSHPSGAEVFVDGRLVGKTPAVASLKNKSHVVEINLDGYEPELIRLRRSLKLGWQILDLCTLYGVGNIVDLLTPNGWRVYPDEVEVDLKGRTSDSLWR